ncbi:Uncharacterised protein [Streptococcus pneumoniae]|nr:Uncharacterised protein [Streptococcus pneumoniae]
MTNLLFVSYSSKISSNRVNVARSVWLLTSSVIYNLKTVLRQRRLAVDMS